MENKIEYNVEYINTHYALISSFLIKADKNVLDISYNVDEKKMTIQVVLLEGFTLSKERTDNVKERLSGFEVVITELYLTKDQFNENKGEWQPRYYKWLDYLLFSKAEVL
ncbi:MAG: hypothetical protein LC107_06425 [Chitinophagales bacterium]|nr:hypothetical protein [Chitinophagales bacterium]